MKTYKQLKKAHNAFKKSRSVLESLYGKDILSYNDSISIERNKDIYSSSIKKFIAELNEFIELYYDSKLNGIHIYTVDKFICDYLNAVIYNKFEKWVAIDKKYLIRYFIKPAFVDGKFKDAIYGKNFKIKKYVNLVKLL